MALSFTRTSPTTPLVNDFCQLAVPRSPSVVQNNLDLRSAGSPAQALLPDNSNVSFQHSFFISQSDAEGNVSSAERDVNDRIVKTVSMLDVVPNPVPVSTIYDFKQFGLLHEVTDDRGHRTTYEHDLLGRATFEDDPDAGQSDNVYDGFDLLRSKTHINRTN